MGRIRMVSLRLKEVSHSLSFGTKWRENNVGFILKIINEVDFLIAGNSLI